MNTERYIIGSTVSNLDIQQDPLVRRHCINMFQDLIQAVPNVTNITRIELDVIEDKFHTEFIMEAICITD